MIKSTDRTSVAIVDDHRLFREGLAAVLHLDERIVVIAQGASGADAIEIARNYPPKVMLLDVEMDGTPVAVTVRSLARIRPKMKIVILTMHEDQVLGRELMHLGAAAFVSKAVPSSQLISAVHRASHQQATASDATVQTHRRFSDNLLTSREVQVVRLMAQALSNAEIARQLTIAEGTVKRHVNNIYSKLEAHSRIDAVRRAGRLGIIGDSSNQALQPAPRS